MEKPNKYFTEVIIYFIVNIFLGLLAYRFGQQAESPRIPCTQDQYSIAEESANSENSFENLQAPNVYSPDYLVELANYERFVYEALTELSKNHSDLYPNELLDTIHEYLSVYQLEKIQANISDISDEEQARFIGGHPLLTLSMLWRFVNELTEIFEEVQIQPNNSQVTNGLTKVFINDQRRFANWPTQWTIEDSLTGLFRMQLVYDLDAAELANGRLFGKNTGKLSSSLVWTIGKFARKKKIYTTAMPWLEFLWKEIYLRGDGQEVRLIDVERVLMECMMEHDIEFERLWSVYFKQNFYQNKLLDENQVPVENKLSYRKSNFSHLRRLGEEHNDVNYWSLCSGENHQTEAEKAKLTCWYDTTSNPALIIFPLKREQLSTTPYVIMRVYDAISETYIKKILEAAKPQLKRSSIGEQIIDAGTSVIVRNGVSTTCTSVDASLTEVKFPKVDKLAELITGLSVSPLTSSEAFLVSSYPHSGHHNCHEDTLDWEQSRVGTGNRIATMMFYLDDVEAGGHTVFTQAGFSAQPIKGSALYWHNLKLNGEPDMTTYHCACPVVLGRKTIANRFIRYNDQFRHRPCGLNQED